MEGARIARRAEKGGAAENKGEDPQPVAPICLRQGEQAAVMARDCKHGGRSSSKNCFGNRTRALIVESPPRAIGQNAPAELAGGEIVHAAQIAKHLG